MPYRTIDLTQVRTYPLPQRQNLVALENLVHPGRPLPPYDNPELVEVAERIVAARRAGRPVIWMIGAHVIKRGLAPLLIDLMRRGIITHIAGNGATTIHDFEIALQGHTSEDVARSLEDGSFGMAEETGALMNGAIRAGARDGIGMGEALGRFIASDERFRYRQYSVLYNAYQLGIPYTVHVAIGTDIIHQHPQADFAAIGWTTGQDFRVFCASVSALEGGVFCNFGSAVMGPEVFLKALSIVRNLGYTVRVFTTANFDLIPLGDYRRPLKDDVPDYYYRPRKNIVNRPVSLGGKGFHIVGDHAVTVPHIHHYVTQQLAPIPVQSQRLDDPWHAGDVAPLEDDAPAAAVLLRQWLERNPAPRELVESISRAFRALWHSLGNGGTLFLAGNGGSMADALHISGELLKSFKRPRPLPEAHHLRLKSLPYGEALAQQLQRGLRAVVLGANLSLRSAVDNDIPLSNVALAQELYALARPGDVLLGISTSGDARNVLYAATVARALGLTIIGLTGAQGGALAAHCDVAVKVPVSETDVVQTWHQQVYHLLCDMLEVQMLG
ncbi:MAG: D-sedoheptulose-7-phosphate isomerase [Anaerolineae bacterium]